MSQRFSQQTDPEEVFSALADETRLAILQGLWDVEGQTASFSELREVSSVKDSGQFNYHLDKLTERFVTKSDDGYQLTETGKYVIGAIRSGVYTGQSALDPIELESSCRVCGGDHTLQYEDEVARIECSSCPAGWRVPVPPVVLAGYDRDEIPHVVSRYFRANFRRIIDGFCSYCSGQMEPTVGPLETLEIGPASEEDSTEPATRHEDLPAVQFDCLRCGATAGIGLDHGLLLSHPAVSYFYYEHGTDIHSHLIWDIDLAPADASVESQQPLRASVTFRSDDATLGVTVDEAFSVIDIDE